MLIQRGIFLLKNVPKLGPISRYGVALVGVRPAELPEFYEDTILLNPGPRHVMKKSDICYYLSITKEENSSFVVAAHQTTIDMPSIKKEERSPSAAGNTNDTSIIYHMDVEQATTAR